MWREVTRRVKFDSLGQWGENGIVQKINEIEINWKICGIEQLKTLQMLEKSTKVWITLQIFMKSLQISVRIIYKFYETLQNFEKTLQRI